MTDEIISAISTPSGAGGVAIIRMSGGGCLEIAKKMFKPTGGKEVLSFEPNRMYAGNIICEKFTDFGMCVYFKAPKSFTGEDVVEFHCHGGVQIARGVFKATLNAGARAASGGEFTKRAFVNGKLSLSSAEGMVDMINAESLAELRAGGLLYREKLTNKVVAVQQKLKDILAQIAADTDYPEEGIEETELGGLAEDLSRISGEIGDLISGYRTGRLIKNGVSVAICGSPNVGKSSLLNALLGYDKAIVSPVAGTTRDAVEGTIEIDGVKYNLTDTAGIRENAGEIESIGIDRAKAALSSADLVICVSDKGDFSAAEKVEGKPIINLFSKTDKNKAKGEFDVAVSAVTGEGLETLKKLIAEKTTGGRSLDGEFLIEERHYLALVRAKGRLDAAIAATGDFPLDLISLDIKACWEALGEVTGETANEEIIDTVFKKFCVGK